MLNAVLGFISWVFAAIRKGWQSAKPHVTLRNGLYALGLVGFLTGVILIYKACNKPPKVKIDESQISKINSENRAERIKELTEVVEANADVIKTVDERTELVEVAAEARNQEVDARVKKADEAIVAAKREGKDISGPELECILLPEKCQ